MSRRANILDSPEIGRRTSNQGVRNVLTRRDNQISADPLRIHLNKLHEMSELIGTSCIESAEELAEAHLEDLIDPVESVLKDALSLKSQASELKNLYQSSSVYESSEEQIKTLKERISEILAAEPIDARGTAEMRAFRRRVFIASHPEDAVPADIERGVEAEDEDSDADMIIADTVVSTICQLTQRTFENPVKNTCGHTYSETAIRQLIRGQSVGCPIAGCRSNVSVASLRPDTDMTSRLERLQNRIF